ncbi:dedicator of cytokinesis protein 1 isoform X2 [Anthonomus grandis grandis]|uniref:dedicator of cytokinesis protein 1 isoform X2 n=1 Tax=Anthonomus grandis grandis TaxID=2921223 RepID=UPI0021660C82|nr:dedicator of cytokinesis protein 1 isoform X2 [Anthonomus grandis grandis]
MTGWTPVEECNSYGIVIYNYNAPEPFKLNITVGDSVYIQQEEQDWFYGSLLNNRHVYGIFPKNYVHRKPCVKFESGGIPVFKDPPICQEITSVLREWGSHWKEFYVNQNVNFEIMKNKMYDLISLRSQLISGALPLDEIKRVTRQATQEIDIGNKILGLDMVVRDKDGNLINPHDTSTIQLFNYHKIATERMNNKAKVDEKEYQPKSAIQQYSNIFLVAVKNFICKVAEDLELLLCLYDAKEMKPITESYVVKWSKEGLMSDVDQIYSLRVMFTDLGKKDLEREKIYLVCYVIRVGLIDIKEVDHRRSSLNILNKKSAYENMRRPCGVAAMDVTSCINCKFETDMEKEFAIPFVSCEKDNLDQTLRRIITREKIENKDQSLFVSMKLLRGDLKQVREENPHLVLGNVSRARKMGFPEVILPGDVRNDLYLTLVNGEFTKGSKTTEKNVEVVVKVCDEKGQLIPGVIRLGGGVQPLDEYRSVIYRHEDKPQWHETFKIALRIEEFKSSHLKFTFKHRSSNETKDKTEKPFAMSYVKLMQENGVTLSDALHNLAVYKIDYKKFDETGLDYFKLPWLASKAKDQRVTVPGLTFSIKDTFNISTNICSTKLTQNVNLLGLLNWATHKHTITDSLQAFMNVCGEEIVKFLQDILDALFNILIDDITSDKYDFMVFECLLYIISLVTNDWKYLHFEPVLDLYVKESFSATLAYKKLISILKSIIGRASYSNHPPSKDNLIFRTMKAFQYIMRFVSRSRLLFVEVYPIIDPEDEFEDSMRELLRDISYMMSSQNDIFLREQGACLKYLPCTIPDILLIFDKCELSNILCDLLNSIPSGRLTKQKMMTINDIVHSKLCTYPECRQILLPLITRQVKYLLEEKDEVELCIKILSDIMELLFRDDIGPTFNDITEVIHTDLRTIIQSHIKMERENPQATHLVAVMLDVFRQMTKDHYDMYMAKFTTDFDKLDFLMEILVVFKELVNNSVFPKDWCDMIMLQNSIILKSLRFFSETIRDRFFDKFEHDAWNNFFHCAIAFMTQEPLQLDKFSFNKRMRIMNQCNNSRMERDMRREMGFEIKSMWFTLGQYKVQFVPSLVGLILEMTLIPENVLRTVTIPIFFDMMQCEFYSSRLEFESYGDTKRDSSHIKGNFHEFENEMIVKLDALFEGGRGDREYKDLFFTIMKDLCDKHTTMRKEGIEFVTIVAKLMERLLEYRHIIYSDSKESTMSCTVSLLDFYSKINKREMYIRYLNKLFDLHQERDNYTEAAFTLLRHAELLKWSNEPLSPLLKSERYSNHAKSHRELKEALYYTIIENYRKGKMWEYAIDRVKELAEQYELETFEYDKLSELHQRLAELYDSIMKHPRPEPEYFRVGYYGKGFPVFLQNKVFVYRGMEYERLEDFNNRILNEFPRAKLLKELTPPGEEVINAEGQFIQINKVIPLMEEKKQRFSGKPVCEQIVRFYRVNNIKKFSFSRRFVRKDPYIESDNEFAHMWLEQTELETTYPLPGILKWFPVICSNRREISPLENAIDTLDKANKELRGFITIYNRDKTVQINILGMTLNGILDAAVMGGIKNYDFFFIPEYLQYHPDDEVLVNRLKDLIADQIPLLDLCVQIHRLKAPEMLQPLHKKLEECFADMKAEVEKKYGKSDCDIKLETEVQIRRHYSINSDTRLSDVTITPDRQSTPYSTKSLMYSPSRSVTGTPISSKKKDKLARRRRSKTETLPATLSTSGKTLWYTSYDSPASSIETSSNGTAGPIIELTQELHPKRPLRSEVEKEKRLSRPSSGQFSRPGSVSLQIRGHSSSGTSSNRDSVGTTDSNTSEISEEIPPPIPAKHKDSLIEFSKNFGSLCINENVSFLHSRTASLTRFSQLQMPLPSTNTNEELDTDAPPTPPPKPPKTKLHVVTS